MRCRKANFEGTLDGIEKIYTKEEWEEFSREAKFKNKEEEKLLIFRAYTRLRLDLKDKFSPLLVKFLINILFNLDFEEKGARGWQLRT